METTIILCNKDLYNKGKCFSAGKEYTINKAIRNEAGLMESTVINDLGEKHTIGSWWREFTIANPEVEEEEEEESGQDGPKNLIDIIFDQMHSDDADRAQQSDILLRHYHAATEAEQKAINNIMICVCGWGIDTLINDNEQFQK